MMSDGRDPFAWLSRPIAGRTVPARFVELMRACLDRLVRIQFVDRAIALGSLAFTALIPLMVIAAAYFPGSDGIADALISRFHLKGSTADLIEEVFAQPEVTRGTFSAIGAILLVGSALSFTRALQRLYELAWRLETRGWKGTIAGLKWLLIVIAWVTVYSVLRRWFVDLTGQVGSLVIALAGGAVLWLVTPYVLLGERVVWRRLIPSALVTSVGMTGLSIGSVVYMPDAIAESAARYGSIGIAIALVSWLVAAGFVLVVCAAVGAVLGGETDAPPTISPPPPPASG